MKKIICTLTLLCALLSFGQTTIGFKTKKNENIDFEVSKTRIFIGNTDNTLQTIKQHLTII